jgi:hypothetical protein
MPDKTFKSSNGAPRITITVPSLSRVKVEGAGETILNKVNTDRLDISYLGAGHLEANGKVKYLRLNAKGVGEVDTKALKAERVDVNFEGVGNVSVYATELLNAVAKGIGGLTYYGHPKNHQQIGGRHRQCQAPGTDLLFRLQLIATVTHRGIAGTIRFITN